MKVLYLGSFIDNSSIEDINKLSSDEGQVSIAAVKYSRLIGEGIEGIVEKKNITKIYLAPMGMFPVCRKMFFYKKSIDNVKYIPFINIILFKQLSIVLYLFFSTIVWLILNVRSKDKVLIFSFVYLPFLLGVIPFKLWPNNKIISFVPDMPSFMFSYSKTKLSFKKILTPVYIFFIGKLIGIIDSYVFITEQMKELFKNKRYIVIEGFIDNNTKIIESSTLKTNKKVLMYSGSLYEKFGIKLLLDAFIGLEGNYELWLFGSGDMVDEIKRVSQIDKRVVFYGNRPNDEVLKHQSIANILINPRFSHHDFTKYSFPSKLMEYMSSGTPVLTTKLPGIPKEYDQFFYYIKTEDVDGFKKSIKELLDTDQDVLDEFAQNAKKFVYENKNHLFQMKKVVSFANELTKA